ncbi:hypothetical protein AMTRI_Chr06g172200 [Amborella trichopoda]
MSLVSWVSRVSQDLGMNSYPVPSSSHWWDVGQVWVSTLPVNPGFGRPIRLPSCCSRLLSILFRIVFRPPASQIQGFDYTVSNVGMEAHSGILAV